MDHQKLTKAYVAIRDKRSALKKDFETEDEKLKAMQTKLEAVMLNILQTSNTDSIRTEEGTFFRKVDILPAGSDWEAFYAWVAKNNAFDALQRRISKTFVADYIEQHGNAPPGVNVIKQYVVQVRRN